MFDGHDVLRDDAFIDQIDEVLQAFHRFRCIESSIAFRIQDFHPVLRQHLQENVALQQVHDEAEAARGAGDCAAHFRQFFIGGGQIFDAQACFFQDGPVVEHEFNRQIPGNLIGRAIDAEGIQCTRDVIRRQRFRQGFAHVDDLASLGEFRHPGTRQVDDIRAIASSEGSTQAGLRFTKRNILPIDGDAVGRFKAREDIGQVQVEGGGQRKRPEGDRCAFFYAFNDLLLGVAYFNVRDWRDRQRILGAGQPHGAQHHSG